MVFDKKVELIKPYTAATISVATLLIIIEQRKIERKNLDNQQIAQQCNSSYNEITKILTIESDAIRIFIQSNHYSIIKYVYNSNLSHTIQNKRILKEVVDKYLKNKIDVFENYYCKKKYSKKLFYFDDHIESYSFEVFKQVSHFLLIPDIDYQEQFYIDLEYIYNEIVKQNSNNYEKVDSSLRYLYNS